MDLVALQWPYPLFGTTWPTCHLLSASKHHRGNDSPFSGFFEFLRAPIFVPYGKRYVALAVARLAKLADWASMVSMLKFGPPRGRNLLAGTNSMI